VKERSTSRSRLRTDNGRRKSARPSRNAAQNVSQIHGVLIFRPNAPLPPRAIDQATCGPVRASVTRALSSSTVALTICPASGREDQTLTSHTPSSSSKVASFVIVLGG
jgi:hypothetical protein